MMKFKHDFDEIERYRWQRLQRRWGLKVVVGGARVVVASGISGGVGFGAGQGGE